MRCLHSGIRQKAVHIHIHFKGQDIWPVRVTLGASQCISKQKKHNMKRSNVMQTIEQTTQAWASMKAIPSQMQTRLN